jgi:hypothetical protein
MADGTPDTQPSTPGPWASGYVFPPAPSPAAQSPQSGEMATKYQDVRDSNGNVVSKRVPAFPGDKMPNLSRVKPAGR